MKLHEIKALVADMDLSVRSDDPRMKRSVHIIHEDGTSLFFKYAYMVRCKNWLLVFTEHNGPHYFAINDLKDYQQLIPVDKPLEVVDQFGVPVVKLQCNFCKNEITAKDICSVYDEMGNRIDADVCEGCEELHNLHLFPDDVTEDMALFD